MFFGFIVYSVMHHGDQRTTDPTEIFAHIFTGNSCHIPRSKNRNLAGFILNIFPRVFPRLIT
jgi:hypothetical protein